MDKVAVVTGAARGIGRAIAVDMAANGAHVVVVYIAGTVSSASNAIPATPEELEETVRMIKNFGSRPEGIKADIRTSGKCLLRQCRSESDAQVTALQLMRRLRKGFRQHNGKALGLHVWRYKNGLG